MSGKKFWQILLILFFWHSAVLAFEVKVGERTVNISAYLQARYSFDSSRTDQFTVPRLRTDIWGDVSSDFGYLVELDAVATPAIIYGWVDYKPDAVTKIRVGRFYYPFSLEYTTPPSKFDFINPTLTLWNIFGYSRDNGLQFSQNWGAFNYSLAVMNGADNQLTDDNETKDLLGRVVYKLSQNLSLGESFYLGKAGTSGADRKRIGAELNYQQGSFGLKAEYIRASDSPVSKIGWYLQPSIWFNPALQGLIRFESWDSDLEASGNLETVTTLGVNAFLNSDAKLQFNYEIKHKESGENNQALLAQVQLKI